MIKLIQVVPANQNDEHYLLEVTLNPAHIVSVNSSDKYLMLLHQNKLPDGLSNNHEFVEISLSNGRTVIAVGSPQVIYEKIQASKKLLLG